VSNMRPEMGILATPLFQCNFCGLRSKKSGFGCKCIARNTGAWEIPCTRKVAQRNVES
jgi:hypothetical protein